MKGCETESDMMGMMSKMMEECEPEMMMDMMPHCFGMMLPKMPKEKRMDVVLKMVGTLVEQGSAGMSENERKEFVAKVVERVKGYAYGES